MGKVLPTYLERWLNKGTTIDRGRLPVCVENRIVALSQLHGQIGAGVGWQAPATLWRDGGRNCRPSGKGTPLTHAPHIFFGCRNDYRTYDTELLQ